jgi:hypothetical protein
MLEEDQHGFRANRSTDSAIANMINALESAKEYSSQILLSSWDLKKAFDSVPKDILVWSWMRLGVPRDLALYLVEMDFRGSTVVKSPLTTKANCRMGTKGLMEWRFIAELGCGQGDIPSPSNWIAMFDMVLTALRMDGEKEFSTMGPYGQALKANDVAYADDLVVVRSNIAQMQRAADIISGFTVLAGLTFSTSKFRAFSVNWGSIMHSSEDKIVVHTDGWIGESIAMETDGIMKHLGVLWDMDLTSTTMWKSAKKTLKEACTKLEPKVASAECKKMAMELSVHRKVGYYAKYLCGELGKFRDLDTPCNSLNKKMTLNMLSFPNDLLYVSAKRGGLGFAQFSEYVLRNKYTYWERMMVKNKQELNIAMGIFTREARSRGNPVIPGSSIRLYGPKLGGPKASGWWFSSCVEWLDELDLSICIPGKSIIETPDEDILSYRIRNGIDLQTQDILEKNRLGVYTVGDTMNQNEYTHEHFPGGAEGSSFRIGQCWAVSHREIWEIVSFGFGGEATGIFYQKWIQPQGRQISQFEKYKLLESPGLPTCQGVASKYGLKRDDFGEKVGILHLQIFFSKERNAAKGTWTTLVDSKSCVPMAPDIVNLDWMIGSPHCTEGSIIFTDGSWDDKAKAGDKLMGYHNYRAGGAVVFMDKEGKYHGYYTIITSKQEMFLSAFEMELMMLILAHSMRGGGTNQIHSDCESAIKVMKDGVWGWNSSKGGLLRAAAANLEGTNISHIAAHPERGVNKDKRHLWSAQEKGIYLADLLAGGKLQEFTELAQSEPIFICERKITNLCFKIAGYGLYLEKKGFPASFFIGDLKEFADWSKMQRYLANRDKETRAIDHKVADPGNHWVGASTDLLASFCRDKDEGLVVRASRVKIGYNKKMTGDNQFHYGIVGEKYRRCRFCSNKDTLEHQISICHRHEVAEARELALLNFEDSIVTLARNKEYKVSNALRIYSNIMLEVENGKHNGTAWLGLWFDEYGIRIRNAINSCDLTGRDYNMLHKTLKKLHQDTIEIHRAYNNAVVTMEMNESNLNSSLGKRKKKYDITTSQYSENDMISVEDKNSDQDTENVSEVSERETIRRKRRRESFNKQNAYKRWAARRAEGIATATREEEAEDPNADLVYRGIMSYDSIGVLEPLEMDGMDAAEIANFVKMRDKWKGKKKKER